MLKLYHRWFNAASNLLQEFGALLGVFQFKRLILPREQGKDTDVLNYLFAKADDLSTTPMVCFVLGKDSSLSLPVSRLDSALLNWREQIYLTR